MPNIWINNNEKTISGAMVYTAPYQNREQVEYVVATEPVIDSIKIRFDMPVEKLVIRPLRYNIEYKITDSSTVEIYPDGRYNFSVEPNGDIHNAVLIFSGLAPHIDRDKYNNVMYFEAGRHFADDVIIDRDNTLVYLEEGAVVDGRVIAKNVNNLAFDGFGTISYECYSNRTLLMNIEGCTDVDIRNITLKDSTGWNMRIFGCDRVHIDNVKIIGYHGNSDGFDICGSRDVLVENCFTRVWDDSLVVKAFDTGDAYNVVFRNCVLWNDFARPMELGVEIRADRMHNIVFEDIDVIHSVTGYPIMGVHHGDRAEVYDVAFRNINIEQAPGAQLFDLRVIPSAWNKDDKMGNVHGVRFENINLIGDGGVAPLPYHSRISGYSDENDISDISFENIRLFGKAARNIRELGLQVFDYASDIRVSATDGPYIEKITTKIDAQNHRRCSDGLYDVKVAVTFCNISDVHKTGKCRLKLSPGWVLGFGGELYYDIEPGGEMIVEKTLRLPAGKYGFSIDAEYADLDCCVGFLDLPLVLNNDFNKCPSYRFADSYGNTHQEQIRFAVDNNVLMIKTDLLKQYDITVYGAKCLASKAGDMLFSIEDTNSVIAPAILMGRNGECVEGPQIGCPEEIAFVFKNYPHVDISSVRLRKKFGDIAYIPLTQLNIADEKEFLLELVLHDKSDKRYDYSLFGSPIPKETIREPRVMAHMFARVLIEKEMA